MAQTNVRLLLCHECKSLEELPDFNGHPERDALLNALVSKHRYPSGTEHRGQLLRVEQKHWDSPSTREAIVAQIRSGAGHTGLDPAFYEAKNTFQEDAMSCWAKHLRNPGCNDYKSDEKLILPDTQADWKAAGIKRPQKLGNGNDRYLCEFCPVHSLVVEAARAKKGMYK